MTRWTASAKWAAGPALDGQRGMPLALRLSEGLGIAGAATTVAGLASTQVLGFDALLRTPAGRPLRFLDIGASMGSVGKGNCASLLPSACRVAD